MGGQSTECAEEIRRLQRCINDLVSVVALPAMWSGAEPSRIVHTLLDALVGMLHLDLAYVRLEDASVETPQGHAPLEIVRLAPSEEPIAAPQEIGEIFRPWFETTPHECFLRKQVGGRELSLVLLGLGLQGEIGLIAAGSERADFPRQTEKLVLNVAANQASIALQEARLRSEQRRVAGELDQRVAQRTAELATANEALRTEIAIRRHTEEDLRSSEEQHRLVVETANDAIVSMDDRGTIQFANPATARIFGYAPADLVGRPLTVLMPASMRELHDHGFRRYLATGHRHINWQGTELSARRRNGEEFPVEISFGELTRDGHKTFIGFIRDISERKLAEDKIRASERNLGLIIETMPGLVWCAAPDGELDYLNRRILDYTGSTPAEWAQLGWTSFLHPNDVEPAVRAWSRAVASGEPYDNQCRFRRSNGVYRWFRALGQAALDSEGKVTRWYGLLIDIDDRKNMEEALRDSQTNLSRATQTATIGQFAASIAHEINQPLAAVVTNGEACLNWLSATPPGLAKAQEAAARIVRDGKEAGEVVRRIRALFKKASIEKIELDLNAVISEVLHLLNGEIVKRRVAVEAELSDDLPPVVADRVQLQQLVFNLLVNAIEAMDPVLDRPRKLAIRTTLESPEIALTEIHDSGAGLEDSEKVFEAFFTTKENGMGMGLALCRSIIDAHHGRLWAASGKGAGSTFSFTLPVQPGAPS